MARVDALIASGVQLSSTVISRFPRELDLLEISSTYDLARIRKVSLGEGEFESATADDHFRYFATFVRTLLTDFAAYLDSGEPALEIDRVGYRQVPLLLTDEEFDRPIATMASAVQEHVDNRPAPGRRQRLLSTIVMPDDRPDVLILLGLGPQRT